MSTGTAQAVCDWEKEDEEIKDWPDQKGSITPNNSHDKLETHPELDAEIERAQRLIKLEQNWDGEGSLGYSKDTLDRATRFLTQHVEAAWNPASTPVPNIGPGPDGSIDLYWKRPSWELLVNIPTDTTAMATFYYETGEEKMRGSLAQNKLNWGFVAWLMNPNG